MQHDRQTDRQADTYMQRAVNYMQHRLSLNKQHALLALHQLLYQPPCTLSNTYIPQCQVLSACMLSAWWRHSGQVVQQSHPVKTRLLQYSLARPSSHQHLEAAMCSVHCCHHCSAWCQDPQSTPLLRQLHWLPVWQWIIYYCVSSTGCRSDSGSHTSYLCWCSRSSTPQHLPIWAVSS